MVAQQGAVDVRRLEVMRVALDVVAEEQLASVVDRLADAREVKQVVLLRWWDFMRARRIREYRGCLREAALVLPVSRSLVAAARLLRGVRPSRYMPFDFVIRVLGALEDRRRSVYVLGGAGDSVRVVEQNLRETYPGMRVVGRYCGFYGRHVEPDILTAIRKAAPDFVLIGPGVPAGDLWVSRRRSKLAPAIYLYTSEVFDIFCDRRKRGSRAVFQRGLDFLPDLLRRPWRLARSFAYAWFVVLLLVHRVFRL